MGMEIDQISAPPSTEQKSVLVVGGMPSYPYRSFNPKYTIDVCDIIGHSVQWHYNTVTQDKVSLELR